MMIFKGRNEELFQTNIIRKYKEDMRVYRYFNIVGIIGIVFTIPSLLWTIETSKGYNESFAIAMLVCILFGTMACVPLLRLSTMYQKKKIYKMSLHKKDIEVYVEDDLTFKVYENNKYCYHIVTVKSIIDTKTGYTKIIEGTIRLAKYGTVEKYELSKTLLDIDKLMTYLRLNQALCTQKQYQNNTLKKVMHADQNTRKKLFVQELKDSHFFLSATVSKEMFLHSMSIMINQEVPLTFQTLDGKLCIYTSKEEIPEEIKKTFPIFPVYSLVDIINFIYQNDSFIFKTKDSSKEIGIVLNPYDEKIELTRKQLTDICL